MIKLSENVQRIEPSATMAIDARAKAMKAAGEDVIGLAAGEPDFPTPQHIVDAAKAALDEGFTKYTPAAGIAELRAAWADKVGRERGVTYKPNQLIVSAGGKQAVYNVVHALAGTGDEVIIPAPYWVSYSDMAKAVGATPMILQTGVEDEFKLRPEALRAAITLRTRLLILCSPSNPTGSVYTRDELAALAEVLIETGVPVLSDEVYDALVYNSNAGHSNAEHSNAEHSNAEHSCEFTSIVSVNPAMYDLTLIAGAVSKAYSMTGWRIGFAAGPAHAINACADLQSHTTSGANSIAQKAALAALTGDQSTVEVMRQEFDRRRQYMVGRLKAIPGLSCFEPTGAFYAFPDISSTFGQRYDGEFIQGSMDFCRLLLEHEKLALVPGSAFGNDNHVRLSYAASMEQIQAALDRLERFVERID